MSAAPAAVPPASGRSLAVAIDPRPRPGAENMALDEALLARVEADPAEAWLRVYGWARPTLSLGFAQRLAASVDASYCRREGIDVVRRITGGRAVLHDREHTYAVVVPYAWLAAGDTLHCCYTLVGEALVAALGRLGIAVEKTRGAAGAARQEACFASAARDEIVLGGRKVVGSAQRRGRSAFLQHGSLLLAADGARHLAAIGQPASGSPPAWTGLVDAGFPAPTRDELGWALAEELGSRLDAAPSAVSVDRLPPISDLVSRHASAAWIGRV